VYFSLAALRENSLACLLRLFEKTSKVYAMKRIISFSLLASSFLLSMLLSGLTLNAQGKVEMDTNDIKNWLQQNWILVAGAIVLLIIIVALSRGRTVKGTRRTTTVVKDPAGHTKSVTTTEEKI
jgi:hypothetical protein